MTRSRLAASQLSGAVSSPLAGPLAAWMPPSSLHGRTCGVSREWRGHRAPAPPGFYPEPHPTPVAGAALPASEKWPSPPPRD
ncbi:hypothetical protein DYQ93_21930 [Xanthomonas sp. LMG 8992]|nr:hypothetical protein [Xanthomonas sp. LMG 8992]